MAQVLEIHNKWYSESRTSKNPNRTGIRIYTNLTRYIYTYITTGGARKGEREIEREKEREREKCKKHIESDSARAHWFP